MSSWGNNDNSANAPYWAVNSTIVNATNTKNNAAAPTAANVALLFGNTTSDVYTVGETIGLFGISAAEAEVDKKGAHTGWVLRTTGSGGRAGRVQEEVLVAMNTMNGDDEDVVYKDTIITIGTQPSNSSIIVGGGNTATFSVSATASPTASLTYQWQVNDAGSWVNAANTVPANTTYTGTTSATLTVLPTGTDANNYVYRVIVTGTGTGATATSANGTLLLA
jgi:hypothetical protein